MTGVKKQSAYAQLLAVALLDRLLIPPKSEVDFSVLCQKPSLFLRGVSTSYPSLVFTLTESGRLKEFNPIDLD